MRVNPASHWRSAERLRGARVLVAIDYDSERDILAHQIGAWVPWWRAVADGNQALAQLRLAVERKRPFDVLVVDLSTGRQTSDKVVAEVNADPQLAATATIVLADRVAGAIVSGAAVVGLESPHAFRLLTKPVRETDLFDCVAAAVQHGDSIRPRLTREGLRQFAEFAGARQIRLPPLAGGRVLLADHQTNQLEVTVAVLRMLGAAVTVVASGPAVLETLSLQDFDLLLMNCHLPLMDGYQVTAQIRNGEKNQVRARRMPIVGLHSSLGAEAGVDAHQRSLGAGMDESVSKPCDYPRLVSAIRQGLQAAQRTGRQPQSFNPLPLAALHALNAKVGPDAARRMVALFLRDTPKRLLALRAEIAAGDREAVARTARSLESASGSVGADLLVQRCRELKLLSRTGALAAASVLMVDVKNAYSAAVARLTPPN